MAVDRDALLKRLRALFLDELDEHVLILNRGLLALEQAGGGQVPAERVHELFRSAHSLKGAASSAGVAPVEAVCHRLEDALGQLRDGALRPDSEALEPLFAAVDAIAAIGREMREGHEVSPTAVDLIPPGAANPAGESARLAGPAPEAEPRHPALVRDPGPGVRAATVRVPAAKLESLMNQAGELIVACDGVGAASAEVAAMRDRVAEEQPPPSLDAARARWRELSKRLDGLARFASTADRTLRHAAEGLADGVRQVRLLPFGQVCDGLDRVVRDLARAAGKEVALAVEGAEVELDRPVLDALREPLLHLVRNAVDHGIEAPDWREQAGKARTGTIAVVASLQGHGVEVAVSDDGRGVDAAAVRASATRQGIGVPDDEDVLLELLFTPGLSTAPIVTEVSGRGVGLDAVRSSTEAVGGCVGVESTPGAGTTVTLTVPLTLSTMRVLLVATQGDVFAIPSSSVARLVRAHVDDLTLVDDRQVLVVEGAALPVLSLSQALGLPGEEAPRSEGKFEAVVVTSQGAEAVLVVHELLDEQEVVIKSLGDRLRGLPAVVGATVLPTGVAPIVNPATCVRAGLGRGVPLVPSVAEDSKARRVLLAEDTATTRALERSILEGAGYEVTVAADGAEAWRLLQEEGADLVVSDVDMPRLDGITLCQAIRASSRFRELPVVLVTSLATEDDRRRGIEVGADAYVVKSTFEQPTLLDIIERLV